MLEVYRMFNPAARALRRERHELAAIIAAHEALEQLPPLWHDVYLRVLPSVSQWSAPVSMVGIPT